MLTLSYGFKKPETNDRGPVVFPALEANWQQVNDHTHDGVNSAKVPASSVTGTTASILSANWNALGGGRYKQTITLPAGYSFDTTGITMTLTTGERVYPGITKVSSTQYDVFFTDNTKSLTVLYGI